jgi:predicted RecB family nuclease
MHTHGLIQTHWGEGLADGAGAMAGAWSAAADSRARGRPLNESPVIHEIARYNEVDCRVMAEILDYLRRER